MSADKPDSHVDKPAERPQSAEPTNHIDRVALLQEGSKASGGSKPLDGQSSAGSGKDQSGKDQPHELTFDNIYSKTTSTASRPGDKEPGSGSSARGAEGTDGADSNDMTRKLGSKHSSPAGHDGPNGKSPAGHDAPKGKSPAAAPAAFDRAPVLSGPANADDTKRNAVVLDDFRIKGDISYQKNSPSHGDVIAGALSQEGFNVYKAQDQSSIAKLSDAGNFGQSLNAINNKIESGQLPLKSGDIVNVSLGNNADFKQKDTTGDPTFKQASDALKMNITPENLKDQKGQILDRLRLVANGQDPETKAPTATDPVLKEKAQIAVDSNDAISKIQDKGISVVHAAGNDGKDRFSWDFMTAKYDLASVQPNGKPDNFSASNSATVPSDGYFPVHSTGPSMLDPTSAARQQANLQLGDKQVFLPGGSVIAGPSAQFNRDNSQPGYGDNSKILTRTPPQVDGAMTSPEATGPRQGFVAGTPPKYQPEHFSNKEPLPKDPAIAKVRPADNMPAAPRSTVGLALGSSFSVVNFLDGKADKKVPIPEPIK